MASGSVVASGPVATSGSLCVTTRPTQVPQDHTWAAQQSAGRGRDAMTVDTRPFNFFVENYFCVYKMVCGINIRNHIVFFLKVY
jgi:hypothetical protein